MCVCGGQKQAVKRNEQRITARALIAGWVDMALGHELERRSGKLIRAEASAIGS